MTTPLRFGVYEQACVGVGGSPSLWTHPLDDRRHSDRLPFWRNLATTLDQSGVDLLFFGDVLGLYDNYRGSHAGAVEWAVEAPAHDPVVHIAALAAGTDRLAFGMTASTTYEHPFALARRFSTLDHLSEGRIGWNVVTSYLDNAARNFGLDGQIAHDDRYDRADEFLEVTAKLWEGSWADDSVVAAEEQHRFARGERVRPIDHHGRFFRVAGPHLVQPSPQRTPFLFQAGWSARGRQFAARHAEGVFVGRGAPESHATALRDLRIAAEAEGRDGSEIRAFRAVRVIVGRTRIDAQRKYDALQENYHLEAQLVSYAGDTGLDLSAYRDDEPLQNSTQGFTSNIVDDGNGRPLTAGDVRDRFSRFTRGDEESVFIGDPGEVADQIARFAEISGVDGFLIAPHISPGTVDDFVTLALPELRARGLAAAEPSTGTLRARLRSDHADRLPPDHPATRFRFDDDRAASSVPST